MNVVIFGRPGCPYCVRAVQLSEQLTEKRDDFKFRYVDMYEEGISKEDLSKTIGKPVATVPQIFLNDQHVGGCTDFEAYVMSNQLL
ncbi:MULTISPECIES: GrxA family glutaredoxin [Shewanella]|uniref:GrxA family glutaredoxin n=2 Tax=Shewanella TaxID=22 RepID=A0A975ALG9_9GAMM|nr:MULTISPECIES: GrxA family glutaredoxin [Shewanella]QSX31437.1 GrxA family glutaredoxin [Shewanella cyperi]QSX35778.1 GrxA family glutaredoxin [Shewanella sedimentimangrovi]QSX42225.1 GrxA family glutaredoxin [Shewanella cyperi]